MPKAARKGDKCQCQLHGEGEIIDGSPTTKIEGKPAARTGDRVRCKDGSIAHIMKTKSCVLIDDKPAARMNDHISHDGKAIHGKISSSSESVLIDDGDINAKLGKNVQSKNDGIFRIYIHSPEINIGSNVNFSS